MVFFSDWTKQCTDLVLAYTCLCLFQMAISEKKARSFTFDTHFDSQCCWEAAVWPSNCRIWSALPTRSLILASLLSSSTVRSILETSAFDAASLTFSNMISLHALSSTMLFTFFHCHWGVIDWSNTGSLILARSTTACLNSLPKETKADGRYLEGKGMGKQRKKKK